MAQKEGDFYAFFYQNPIISKMGITYINEFPSLLQKGKSYLKACWKRGLIICMEHTG